MKKIVMGAMCLSLFFSNAGWPAAGAADGFSAIDQIMGTKGQMQEGAYVVRFPRSDLKMSIGGEAIPTAFGFGGWAAFKDVGKQAMIMGDLVLLQEEVNPVISALHENGLEITALHNHFFYEEPRIFFMHIGGMGPKEKLAQGLRQALDKTATPGAPAAPPTPASPLQLNTAQLEKIVGHPGQAMGPVFKITVGRGGVKMAGVEITSSMGLNSWVAFVGTQEQAHVAGDIVMNAREVNPVIKALRAGGVEVVAVHNHMLNEQPRVFFLHYWGSGPADALARTVRAAFDQAKGPIR
jgi:biotin operon repressor